jgi:hypothetical protein
VGRRWQQVVEQFGSTVDHARVFSHVPPPHEPWGFVTEPCLRDDP